MANRKSLDNWSRSTIEALDQYNKVANSYEVWRFKPTPRNKLKMQIYLQTLILYIFEERNILDKDTQMPIIEVSKSMIKNPKKLLDDNMLIAAMFAILELINKIGLYKIGIGGSDATDITKTYQKHE